MRSMVTIEKILQGERVYLRRYTPDDLDLVLAGSNEPEGARLTGTHDTFTREQVARYIENNRASGEDPANVSRAAFICADTADDRAVGEVVINEIDHANRSANIRIAIFNPSDWNRGYGSEALHLMVGYGFETLKLHRIELGVYDFNPRAVRVYEKIGFKREGVLRDALLWDGAYYDMIIMSILEHEWTRLSSSERQ